MARAGVVGASDAAAFWQQELMKPALLFDRARGAEPILVDQTRDQALATFAAQQQQLAVNLNKIKRDRGGRGSNPPPADRGTEFRHNFEPEPKRLCRTLPWR